MDLLSSSKIFENRLDLEERERRERENMQVSKQKFVFTAAAMSAGLALIRAARMSTKNTKSLRGVARERREIGGYESVDEGTSSVGIRRTISGCASIGVYSCSGSTSCVYIGIHGIRGNHCGDATKSGVSLDRRTIFSSSGRGIVKGLDVNERST